MADKNLAIVGALRQRFHVELKPDETTFVSWKKLVKDLPKAVQNLSFEPPAGAHPALQARIAPEATTGNSLLQNDPGSPPSNRFSAVIEKIERLYKGDESSEEEQLDKNHDDDQYDTEDSFIDDTELDEYFSVDKAKTKHTGFFVNRGKLEPVHEPASPVLAPKKRKRKDIKKAPNAEEIPKKLLKMGAVRIKAAARTAPLVGMNVKSSGQDITSLSVNEYSDEKASKRQESKSTSISCESGLLKAGFQETASKVETSVKHAKACDKNGGFLNGFLPGGKDSTVKGEIVAEPSVDDIFNNSSKHTNLRDDCLTRESMKGVSDVSTSDKIIAIERAGEDSFTRDVNAVGNKLSVSKVKSSLSGPKEAFLARPKCTILEKAFQDLEKGVVELCPPTADVRESEQFQGVKKRLPREVKQKLGKVARLAAKQGKISDEVITRLMTILGHVMRLKTLKRNLKEMVESGISAKQEKEGRIQDIKREVTKMVQMQVSSLHAQDGGRPEGSADDFQGASCTGEKGKPNGCYTWDNATEDAICNLYDHDQFSADMLIAAGRLRMLAISGLEWTTNYVDV
ncbi:hypothetical protein KI387_019570 [Taxus chinensis]|uniref:Hpc2-related domain-containing protein n=1 Tax=Taxus chinensis TaxID=29808 RepID=A0AA38G6N2_TAXCH|nr:hypothetical protein KI387_019570 [Taxus chinensis]